MNKCMENYILPPKQSGFLTTHSQIWAVLEYPKNSVIVTRKYFHPDGTHTRKFLGTLYFRVGT